MGSGGRTSASASGTAAAASGGDATTLVGVAATFFWVLHVGFVAGLLFVVVFGIVLASLVVLTDSIVQFIAH